MQESGGKGFQETEKPLERICLANQGQAEDCCDLNTVRQLTLTRGKTTEVTPPVSGRPCPGKKHCSLALTLSKLECW